MKCSHKHDKVINQKLTKTKIICPDSRKMKNDCRELEKVWSFMQNTRKTSRFFFYFSESVCIFLPSHDLCLHWQYHYIHCVKRHRKWLWNAWCGRCVDAGVFSLRNHAKGTVLYLCHLEVPWQLYKVHSGNDARHQKTDLPTGHKTFDQHCYNVSHQCWITVEI